jgi:hypothetical protein
MDYANPSEQDLREWAYNPDAEAEQDFDLMVAELRFGPLLVELAGDPNCPMREFFLSCLYLVIGNHFRGWHAPEHSRKPVSRSYKRRIRPYKEFVENSASNPDPLIQNWVSKSRQLLSDPRAVSYEDWCGGRIARREIESLVTGNKAQQLPGTQWPPATSSG